MAKINELSERVKKAYGEPIEVAGKGIKDGIDNAKSGIESRQTKMRAKRTKGENFIISMTSGIVGFFGAYVLFVNDNFVVGFIIMIIAVIISLLPSPTPK